MFIAECSMRKWVTVQGRVTEGCFGGNIQLVLLYCAFNEASNFAPSWCSWLGESSFQTEISVTMSLISLKLWISVILSRANWLII